MKAKKTAAALTAAVAAVLAGQAAAQTTSAQTSPAAPRPLQPLYGDISPFYGDISPFYGDISPFYGDISPFWGDISPFYGDITSFWGDISPFYGDISPFYGDISPFWGDIAPFWGDIGAFWKQTDAVWASGGLVQVADNLRTLTARSEQLWGAAVQARTGKSFAEGFANTLFARYGIDPNRPETLQKLSAAQRQRFFLDWYDGLMAFSGMDHVDHWMKSINWTPALTQVQGDGRDAVIGLLDFFVAGDRDVQSNIRWFDGVSTFSNGHGAAVAGLMVADHDGKGVMGIAPQASVVAYNPFDATGTASWADVRAGVLALTAQNAQVINMSLGVEGWTLHPDWRTVFGDSRVAGATKETVFVLAAGNAGVTQAQNVAWSWANDPNLIVVGSVDPFNQISAFSNRPGETCLLRGGTCASEFDKLKYRFMVAPGELLLVSDDQGGVERRSGTSFAAPLVSGTIALLHDRWPWLARTPRATTEILFRSARDLGAPGVDGVYGWGLLDAGRAMSVLDADKLQFWLYENGDVKKYGARDLGVLRPRLDSGVWETTNAYVYLFEPLSGTQRDFAIPLSTQLTGSVNTRLAGEQLFQRFLQQWLFGVIRGQRSLGETETFNAPSGWTFTSTSALAPQDERSLRKTAPVHYRFGATDPSGKLSFAYGFGAGPLGLARQSGFALPSDYDVATGGVNPLLGFAAGGPFAGAAYKPAANLTISAGASRDGWNEAWREDAATPFAYGMLKDLRPYRAGAVDFGLAWDATSNLTVKANYTRLQEADAIMGVQSRLIGDLSAGSTTEGVTLGADVLLPRGFALAASGTLGRTRQTEGGAQNLQVTEEGLKSSAWQLALTKHGVFGKNDGLRLSLTQPLHVEDGELEHASVQVVDRNTGEIGLVRERVRVSGGERDYAAHAVYVRSVLDGRAELQGYARAETAAASDPTRGDLTAGIAFKLRY